MSFHKNTENYLNAVVNPFDADEPCQVPDLSTESSICLRDNGETSGLTYTDATEIYGICCFLFYGYSGFKNAYAGQDQNGQDAVNTVYGVGYFFIDATGVVILPQATNTEYGVWTPNNYQTIMGSAANVNTNNSLVTSIRPMAAGLRMLPTIEQVTDSSKTYISYVIGGQISPAELSSAITNSYDVRTMLKNTPDSEIYGNNAGVCTRYDPFQNTDQLTYPTLPRLIDDSWGRDPIRMPCFVAQFSQGVSTTNPQVPVIVHQQWWFEGVLKSPTPIYSVRPPIDPAFDQVKAAVTQSNVYPLVTKGHSFDAFLDNVDLFLRHARRIQREGSKIYRSSRNIARRFRTNPNKRKKRKKRKKRQPRLGVGPRIRPPRKVGNIPKTGRKRRKRRR
jgi:hypothetical protein